MADEVKARIDPPRNRHHRKPRSANGNSKPYNISSVRMKDHEAYHRLFGPGLPEVVAKILNEIWIDPDYELVVRRRHKKSRHDTRRKIVRAKTKRRHKTSLGSPKKVSVQKA